MPSLFDTAFALESERAVSEMGEALVVNGTGVEGIVSPVDQSSELSAALGGRTELPSFNVHLTAEAAQGCAVRKGSPVVWKTVTARVSKLTDMGSAGVMLECGPPQTRDL